MSDELEKLTGAAAAVDAMGVEAAPVEQPKTVEAVPSIDPGSIAAVMGEARMYVNGVAALVADRWQVGLSDETKERGAAKLAPLLVKYDFDSPFLRKWKAEIDALVFIGATGYGIYRARKSQGQEAAGGDVGK